VKPNFKNHERIDHVKVSGPLKSTIITKILTNSLFEMEKILILWTKYQKNFPLGLLMIQARARRLFEGVTVNASDPEAKFMTRNVRFHRFNLYRTKVTFAVTQVKV
jgi:hypothetical protein